MDVRAPPAPTYIFGPYRLYASRMQLERDGHLVPMTPRVLATLLYLVENAGRLVSKDEMLHALWPGRIAEEANLSQAISAVRRALGPAEAGPLIVTVPGKGYRFTAMVGVEPAGGRPPALAFADGQASPTPPKLWATRRTIMLGVSVVALAAATLASGLWWSANRRGAISPGTVGSRLVADRAFREAEYAWQKRTPSDLRRAADDYAQAVVADPSFSAAYAGLAQCYNLMPEFGGMSAAQAYPRAQAAAEQAVALDPSSASAHRALAFSLFWWSGERQRGLDEFRNALRLDPQSAQAHHSYANALAAVLDPSALAEISRAQDLDPSSTPVKADSGWIAYMLGRFDQALETLNQVAEIEPSYAATFRYRGAAKRALGDYAGMLDDLVLESKSGAAPDLIDIANAGRRALLRAGPVEMFRAMAQKEERLLASGRFAAARVAADELMADHPDRALELLALTKQNREWFVSVITNPVFTPLRSDPRFQRLSGGQDFSTTTRP